MVSRKNATSASDRLMPSCRPTTLSSSGVGSFALATRLLLPGCDGATLLARPSLHVDAVRLVVVRVLLEITHRGGVRGRLLLVALQHLERPILRLGDVDVEAAVVRLRIDRSLAGRAAEAHVALERLDHLHAVDAVALLHAAPPQVNPG